MSGRGMKKWAPYASLIEQKGTVMQMKKNRQAIPKPILSQEQANELNEALLNIKQGPITLSYYRAGQTITITGGTTRINYDEKYLILNEHTIKFHEIVKLKHS